MSLVIIGFGTQGKKRSKILKKNKINHYIIDPFYNNADSKNIETFKIKFTHAFICTPDSVKYKLIIFLLKKNIKILVEKPLYLNDINKYRNIKKLLQIYKKSKLYVAYNHRFEPNIIRLKKYLNFKNIGKIYSIEMYYGNGTAKLWSNSDWRKKDKKGVITDLAPHLLDIYLFLFGKMPNKNTFLIKSKNENKNIDHAIFGYANNKFICKFTTSLINWKNKFEINIIGSNGSAHVQSLCKWTDSKFIYRRRVKPSGVPKEVIFIEKKGDPTWMLEHEYFLKQKNNKIFNYYNDIVIKKYIDSIFYE